jgi:hypothetical protein
MLGTLVCRSITVAEIPIPVGDHIVIVEGGIVELYTVSIAYIGGIKGSRGVGQNGNGDAQCIGIAAAGFAAGQVSSSNSRGCNGKCFGRSNSYTCKIVFVPEVIIIQAFASKGDFFGF